MKKRSLVLMVICFTALIGCWDSTSVMSENDGTIERGTVITPGEEKIPDLTKAIQPIAVNVIDGEDGSLEKTYFATSKAAVINQHIYPNHYILALTFTVSGAAYSESTSPIYADLHDGTRNHFFYLGNNFAKNVTYEIIYLVEHNQTWNTSDEAFRAAALWQAKNSSGFYDGLNLTNLNAELFLAAQWSSRLYKSTWNIGWIDDNRSDTKLVGTWWVHKYYKTTTFYTRYTTVQQSTVW